MNKRHEKIKENEDFWKTPTSIINQKLKRISDVSWKITLFCKWNSRLLITLGIVCVIKNTHNNGKICNADTNYMTKEFLDASCVPRTNIKHHISEIYEKYFLNDDKTVYPGVGSIVGELPEWKNLSYYFYVGEILIFQGILAKMIGYLLSRRMYVRNGLLENIITEYNSGRTIEQIHDRTAKEMNKKMPAYRNSVYWILGTEILNIIILIFCIDSWNRLLDGRFLTYGLKIIQYHFDPIAAEFINPEMRNFPMITSCTLKMTGGNGKIENRQGICILGLNPAYAKLMIFIWFWYAIMLVLMIGGFIIDIRFLSFKNTRTNAAKTKFGAPIEIQFKGETLTFAELQLFNDLRGILLFKELKRLLVIYYQKSRVKTTTFNAKRTFFRSGRLTEETTC